MWLLHSHPGCSLPALALRSVTNLLLCPFFVTLSQHSVGKREEHRRSPCKAAKVSSALSPCTWVQEQGVLFSPCRGVTGTKRIVYRLRKTAIRDWFRSLPVLQSRAQLQLELLDQSALGLHKKGSKWTPKIKITAKSWRGELPVFNSLEWASWMVVVRAAQSRDTFRFKELKQELVPGLSWVAAACCHGNALLGLFCRICAV